MPLLAAGLGPIGVPELLIIAFIVILVFGVGRLPEVGGALGKGIREFRKSTKEEDEKPADTKDVAMSSAQPDGATAADAIFCSECGGRNQRGAKFCANCGNAIVTPVG